MTRRELDAAGQLDTVEGQRALALARRLDTYGAETAAGFVALIKEHRTSLDNALAVDEDDDDDDDLDDLAAGGLRLIK